ncbi:MAG: phosphonate metabolism protein/1,5-bisphosphokinase (PRPP-forming) PhnN [Paracoccus sp. (in: a-proteobacteria)]|nr:phosphonate metabolism protein/1,5-bisphosphokinase (PRPP-forming) PhnN [Paracoccus sp. (in: a-proteobacteria)]
MSARVIGIVGPSGAGKDTLMRGAAAADPRVSLVRRAITRPADAGGEDYDALSEAEFRESRAAGRFALDWQAHGLCYGVPHGPFAGRVALVNLSRGVLAQAAEAFPGFAAIEITLPPGLLAQRLAARGREDADDIAARLARAPAQSGAAEYSIDNSGPPERGVAELLSILNELSR